MTLPHLAHEQDAALSIYSTGETYISASDHAGVVRDAVAELMHPPVPDRLEASPTGASLGAAGATVGEADPAQRVASDPAVVDAESDPSYRDRVQHCLCIPSWVTNVLCPIHGQESYRREDRRRDRLSRWQEQR